MKKNDFGDRLISVAANYVQLCGTLAGFCGAFILFLMSPGLFPERNPESSIILLLCAAFGYVYSAAWGSLVPSLSPELILSKIRMIDNIFIISNLFLWISFSLAFYTLDFKWAFLASIILLLMASTLTWFISSKRMQKS